MIRNLNILLILLIVGVLLSYEHIFYYYYYVLSLNHNNGEIKCVYASLFNPRRLPSFDCRKY